MDPTENLRIVMVELDCSIHVCKFLLLKFNPATTVQFIAFLCSWGSKHDILILLHSIKKSAFLKPFCGTLSIWNNWHSLYSSERIYRLFGCLVQQFVCDYLEKLNKITKHKSFLMFLKT